MFETIASHTVFTPPISRDSLVLDLGANRGEFSAAMSDRFGGRYYLVEANPALAEELRVEGRFPVLHCAVADYDGTIDFNIAENELGSSILALPEESGIDCTLRETINVPARTLESIIAEMALPHIDLLKMDIEGAEVSVLQALPRAILTSVGQITVEFHGEPRFGFDLHRDVERAIRRLRRHGFCCLEFSSGTRIDVLFVNRCFHGISWLRAFRWEFRTSPPQGLSELWTMLPPAVKNAVSRMMDRFLLSPRDR